MSLQLLLVGSSWTHIWAFGSDESLKLSQRAAVQHKGAGAHLPEKIPYDLMEGLEGFIALAHPLDYCPPQSGGAYYG